MWLDFHNKNAKFFRYFSVALHIVGSVHFIFTHFYDWYVAIIPGEADKRYPAFAYKIKFLTNWDLVTQACYFTFCIIVDFYGTRNEKNERNALVKIKDYVEASIAFPIAMFVGITFWALMAVDRELVLPSALDPYFPSWLNHMMHTNILIFQLLEVFTSSRVYPPRKHALLGLITFQSVYLTWMHIVHYKSGVWAYPIFEKLNVPLRIGFLAGCFTLGGLLYFAGEKLHSLLWKDQEDQSRRHHVD